MPRTLSKPLTRPADGWRLATCHACQQTNYVNPLLLAPDTEGALFGGCWCQTCRKDTLQTVVSNSAAPAIL